MAQNTDVKKYNENCLVEGKNGYITATMDPDSFKSFFYLLTGKPDTKFKSINADIIITKEDIIDLDKRIIEKLVTTNRVFNNCIHTSINVSFNNSKNKSSSGLSFDSVETFSEHDWNEPDYVQSVILKWDFCITLDRYIEPQRHTITISLSSGAKPIDILQAIILGEQDDIHEIEEKNTTIFCRVDFINNILADEIINLVEKWSLCCQEPKYSNNKIINSEPFRFIISNITEYMIPLSSIILMIFVFEYFFENPDIKLYFYLLLVAYFVISLSLRLGFIIAKSIYGHLSAYGDFNVFEITKGDLKRSQSIIKSNKRILTRVALSMLFTTLQGVLCGVLGNWLWEKIKI